jgi:HEAT repeat protein
MEPVTLAHKAGWRQWLAARTLIVPVAAGVTLLVAVWVVMDSVRPIVHWTRAIRRGSLEQRLDAAQALGSIPADDVAAAVPALAAALGDVDERVATTAAQSLADDAAKAHQAGVPNVTIDIINALTAALKDARPGVREGVARAIGSLAGEVFVEPPKRLIAVLEGDPDVEVRVSAARALGRYGAGLDAVPLALLRSLGGKEPRVRTACGFALSAIHSAAINAAIQGTAVTEPSPTAIPALIEMLGSRDRDVRYHASSLLSLFGPEAEAAVPALRNVLAEPDPQMLSAEGSESSGDPATRAAYALGKIAPGTPRAKEAVATLVETMRSAGDASTRGSLASSLAKFKPSEGELAVPVLIDMVKENVAVMGPPAPAAASALGRLAPGTPRAGEAVAVLTTALGSGWEYTRLEAATALGRFQKQAASATEKLRALAESDPIPPVRRAAAAAIRQIEDEADEKKSDRGDSPGPTAAP